MKWWGWVLIGLVLGATIVLLTKGDPTEAGQAWLDSLNVERERSAVLARDSIRQEAALAAAGLRVAEQERELARLRVAGQQTAQALATARRTAQEAQTALGAAQSMADSFPLLKVALGAERTRADIAESLVANRDQQIAAGALLLAAVRDSVGGVTVQRDSARAEAQRWRRLAEAGEPIISDPPKKWGRAAETLAIGAATYQSCREGVFTLGCVSGLLVTGNRVL